MSFLPKNDTAKAKKGLIYLCENSRTYYVKGMDKPAEIPAKIDLNNLERKIAESSLKTAILDITSNAGHTEKNDNPFKICLADTSIALGKHIDKTILNIKLKHKEAKQNLFNFYFTLLLTTQPCP